MDKESIPAFKVGLMVAIGLVFFAILIYLAGGIRFHRRGYTLTILFSHVAGLDINSPVRLAGMEVGEVKKMWVRDGKIAVGVWIEKDARIHEGARANIESLGLIGAKYVALTMGDLNRPCLGREAIIIGQDPVSIGQILSRGEVVVQKVEQVIKALDGILGKNEIIESIERILGHIESFSRNLDLTLTKNVTKTTEELHKFSKELREASEEFRAGIQETAPRLKRVLHELDKGLRGKGDDIEETLGNLKEISQRLTSVTESLANITAQIESGEGVAGKIVFDKEMAESLSRTIKDLRELVKDLKAHPWKLMKKK